jgi:uncharacterized protein involved in outer membrane biogenesis
MTLNLRRFLRWLAGGATAVLLAVVAVALFGDLSQFRGRIERAATEQLGRSVSIRGEIRLQPMLPLRVELQDIQIANPDWASRPELARIGTLRLELSLPSLLKGTVRIGAVDLVDFELMPEISADGRRSWDSGSATTAPITLPSSVELRRGTIAFVDNSRAISRELTVNFLEVFLEADETQARLVGAVQGRSFEAQLNADPMDVLVASTKAWAVQARVETSVWSVAGTAARETDGTWSAIVEGRSDEVGALSDWFGIAVPPFGPLSASMAVSVADDVVQIEDLLVEADSVKMTGTVSVDSRVQPKLVVAKLQAQSVVLDDLLAGVQDPSSRDAHSLLDKELLPSALAGLGHDIDLQLDVSNLTHGDLEVGPVSVRIRVADGSAHSVITTSAMGGTFDARVDVEITDDVAYVAGTVAARDFDAGQLSAFVGGASVAGEQASLEASFASRGNRLRDVIGSLSASLSVKNVVLNLPGDSDAGIDAASIRVENGQLQEVDAAGRFRGLPLTTLLRGNVPLLAISKNEPLGVRLSAAVGNLKLELDGLVSEPLTAPRLTTAVAWTADDVGQLLPLVGLESASLFASKGTADIEADAQSWSLKSLTMDIGSSSLEGSIAHTVNGDKRIFAGALSADTVHIKELELLARTLTGTRDESATAQTVVAGNAEFLIDLDVKKFADGLERLTSVSVRLKFDNHKLRLDPLSAMWSGKPVSGVIEVTLQGAQPGLHAEIQGTEFDLGAVSALLASSEALTGQADWFSVEVDAIGFEPQAWPGVATGTIRIDGGSLAWSDNSETHAVKNLSVELNASDNQALTGNLSAAYRDQPVHVKVALDSIASLRANEQTAITLGVESQWLDLSARGFVERPLSADGVRLSVAASGETLAALHARGMLPSWIDGPFKFGGEFEIEGRQLSLHDIAVEFPEIDISGRLSLPLASNGKFSAELRSKVITIPDLFEAGTGESSEDAPAYLIPPLPLGNAVPDSIAGELSWQVDKLWVAASAFRDVRLEFSASDGVIDVRHSGITDQTDGRYEMVLSVDPNTVPSGTLSGSGDSFDLGWLLPDTGTGKPWWPVDFDIDLTGPGRSLDWFLGHANGEVHFIAGKTEGAEFDRWDLTLFSLMLPSMGEAPKDQLECVVLNAEVVDGVASTDALVAETQSIVIAGGGKLDMRSEKLGLLLTAKPRNTTLTGVSVPLKVGGTLANPEFAPASDKLILKAGKLLLGVANPFALIGIYVISKVSAGNSCESALKVVSEKYGVEASVEVESSGGLLKQGLFGFLGSDRERSTAGGETVNQARE